MPKRRQQPKKINKFDFEKKKQQKPSRRFVNDREEERRLCTILSCCRNANAKHGNAHSLSLGENVYLTH